MDLLDAFFNELPKGWQYGVEIRNRSLLQPDYFDVLRKHGVAHVFNNWTRMPSVGEQWTSEGTLTNDAFTAARFLLKPGRTYEEAVQAFSPYASIKEPNDEARSAMLGMIKATLGKAPMAQRRATFIYINNRLEGNSLLTIMSLLKALDLPADVIADAAKPKQPPATLL